MNLNLPCKFREKGKHFQDQEWKSELRGDRHIGQLYRHYRRTQPYEHPLNTDTLLIRTVFFIPGESLNIFSKFNTVNADTCSMRTADRLASCPFYRKVNLANADTSLSLNCVLLQTCPF